MKLTMTCLLAAAAVAASPSTWYGPVTVTSTIPYSGNPYDPAENDVNVEFVGSNGQKLTRLAYFVGDGKFSSVLVAPSAGSYTAHFIRNGKQVAVLPEPVRLAAKQRHGFIGLNGRHFQWSDGTPFFPIGYDYAWRSIPNESVAQGVIKMGRTGCNWSRIWATAWDDRNPWWPGDGEKVPARQLRQKPLDTWDSIVQAAEVAGVHFQFVLFHHGQFSSTTDSNWKENPWNTANGGFLSDPTDFFSNPEAKQRARIWLRYAVARYASSPSVFAWELFNEVQWTDAAKNPARVAEVAAWHREMADYVRSIDPYHHPVTSSSSEDLNSHVFDAMDYLQPHTYPANVLAAIGGYRFPERPGFFGEFGPPSTTGFEFRQHVRDGIYGGMLAGHAGCGMFWYWDVVGSAGLRPSYTAARRVIDESGLLKHLEARPLSLTTETPHRGSLTVSPAGGWEHSKTTELHLPGVTFEQQKGWSPYFQSTNGHKEWAAPFILKFKAAEPGKLAIQVGDISAGGGDLTAWVNEQQAYHGDFKSGQTGPRPPVLIPFAAGPVTVRLENHGADWIRLDSISVPGLSPTAHAHGLGDRDWALVRVAGSDTSKVTVRGLGLHDGPYRAIVFDADTGQRTTRAVIVKGGRFEATDLPKDSVIALSRE